MDYNWEASFVLNGAKCSKGFTTRGWTVRNLRSKGKDPRVKLVFSFTRRRYIDYWRLFDFVEKKINEILDAMAPDFFYNIGSPYFPKVSNFELDLKNVAQLTAAGKRIPSHGRLCFNYHLVIGSKELKTTLRRRSQIQRSPNASIIRHALLLYRRGLSHEDCFDKFFTLWRSFNAIYRHFGNKKKEHEQISDVLDKLDPNDITYLVTTYSKVQPSSELAVILGKSNLNLFQYLVGKNLTDDNRRNRSQELKQAISTGQQLLIVKNAMLCLYVVRCNIAHGSSSQISQDKDLSLVSATFLAAVLMCFRRALV